GMRELSVVRHVSLKSLRQKCVCHGVEANKLNFQDGSRTSSICIGSTNSWA
ncbi:MAG: hypothetical protein ACD_23C00686G0001, partial [uncultured bacterium]